MSEPKRSYSPPPASTTLVQVSERSTHLRVPHGLLRKVLPWLVPIAMSMGGGWVVGYFQGLKAAGARIAAVEETARLAAEDRARIEARIKSLQDGVNRAVTIAESNEQKLIRIDRSMQGVGSVVVSR